MMMALVSNFGDNPRLLFVCAVSRERLVARVVVCVLAMVNGWWGCSYRFLAGFLLINRSTLFSLINKNSKSFDWLKWFLSPYLCMDIYSCSCSERTARPAVRVSLQAPVDAYPLNG
jgi:hypothetical protein